MFLSSYWKDDTEVVETHLALGVLFRRRGEVGRAIRIHQNLIARPNLPKPLRAEALLALGQDYLKAGMLDRAERLFIEFTEAAGGQHAWIGLRHLLDIYQQEKNWEAAIATANKLTATEPTIQKSIAHYCCELALQAKEQGQIELAQKHLKRALEADSACTRASLLQAEFEIAAGRFKQALQVFQRAVQQDSDYLTEMVAPIILCYEQLEDEEAMQDYLQLCLQKYPRTSVLLALASYRQCQQGDMAAAELIAQHLQHRPSIRGLQRLITLQLNMASEEAKKNLTILYDLVANLLKNKPIYRCGHCGFNGKVLHWLCPSCRHWGSIKPIQGVEGE